MYGYDIYGSQRPGYHQGIGNMEKSDLQAQIEEIRAKRASTRAQLGLKSQSEQQQEGSGIPWGWLAFAAIPAFFLLK